MYFQRLFYNERNKMKEKTKLTEMNNPGLGSIIRSLQLWNIHNRAAHARRPDEASIFEILNLLPAAINALELLSAPDPAGGTSTEKGTVEIGSDDFTIMFDLAVDGWSLGPGNARIGNEDVQAGVEFGYDLVDDGVDIGLIGDVELVSFACCLLRSASMCFSFLQSVNSMFRYHMPYT